MEILDKIGYAVCHQLPERSIFIDSRQLPVCARDTGLYVGSLLSLLFILLSERKRSNTIPVPYISFTFVLFILLLSADGLSSYLGFRGTNNDIRLITGLLVGISLPFFLYPILIDNLSQRKDEKPILNRWHELILLIFLITAAFFLILHFNFKLYYPLSFSTVAGIFTLHYLIIIAFLSLIVYDIHFKKKIIKPLLVFSSGIIVLFTEFMLLTKLHNLVNK